MYRCAKPEKKKAAGGLLLSAALACMLTGITEPLEFSFLFVAPALFAVQVVLAGAAYMIAHMLNIAVGLTFSGGFLDLFLFGILQGNAKTSWLRIIPVGIIYFILYYVIFTFLIKKFNFKTPGREDDDTETKLYTKADVNARKEAGKAACEKAGGLPSRPVQAEKAAVGRAAPVAQGGHPADRAHHLRGRAGRAAAALARRVRHARHGGDHPDADCPRRDRRPDRDAHAHPDAEAGADI